MSHNIYNDELEKSEDNSTKYCNYLIYCGINENEEIIPCSCLETVLKIATIEKQICRVFKRTGSLGKKWDYMCDISVGVL